MGSSVGGKKRSERGRERRKRQSQEEGTRKRRRARVRGFQFQFLFCSLVLVQALVFFFIQGGNKRDFFLFFCFFSPVFLPRLLLLRGRPHQVRRAKAWRVFPLRTCPPRRR